MRTAECLIEDSSFVVTVTLKDDCPISDYEFENILEKFNGYWFLDPDELIKIVKDGFKFPCDDFDLMTEEGRNDAYEYIWASCCNEFIQEMVDANFGEVYSDGLCTDMWEYEEEDY